jgi:ABC-type transport system involved in multi-copper enzyme maturation permease subunit
MSEIHDQSYRRYRGEKMPHGRTWQVIAQAGIRTFFARRAFLGLLLASWLPFFVRAVQIYVSANVPQAQALDLIAVTPETFREFLNQQQFFGFLITVYVGSGLIANDRRANALQLYLSKPLTRAEYVLGKMAILMCFLLLVTWVPCLLLLVLQAVFAGSFAFLTANLYLFPAITLFSFLQVVMVSSAMLALSSLSNSSRYVGILYAALVFFSQALFNVMRFVTGGSVVAWMSFEANLDQVGNAIFRLPLPYETPWPVSLLMVIGLIAASGFVLERRVRGVEIVA